MITPNQFPLRGRVERYNHHHSRVRSVVERDFGMMKARWRATCIKALEVSPAFAPDIIDCCAFLYNLCLKTVDITELEDNINPVGDLQVPYHDAQGGQETTRNHIRDRMAAFLSAPALFPQHLQEHDYP